MVTGNSQHGFTRKKLCFYKLIAFYDEISGGMDKSWLAIRLKG